MIAPSVFCDANGDYRGADGRIHRAGYTTYSTFSLWDAYRAAYPLMTLVCPDMQSDLANTFMSIFREQGKLPVWHLAGCETNCMVGSPGVPILADLVLKGFVKDKEQAYEALKNSMMLEERSLGLLKKHGFIPGTRSRRTRPWQRRSNIVLPMLAWPRWPRCWARPKIMNIS